MKRGKYSKFLFLNDIDIKKKNNKIESQTKRKKIKHT